MAITLNGSGTGCFTDATGNVGVGISSPTLSVGYSGLQVAPTSGGGQIIINNGTIGKAASDGLALTVATDGVAYIWNSENTPIVLATNALERLRIDNSGNVGVGTASPSYKLHIDSGVVYASGGFIGGTSSTTSVTSPLAWNSNSYAQYSLTALANALTISADAGSPVDTQKMTFRIKDNGTPRVVTFTGGSSKAFRNVGTALVTSSTNWTLTTVANKTYYVGCIYNSADSRWDVVSLAVEA